MPLHAGAGGADKSHGICVDSSIQLDFIHLNEAVILSPRGEGKGIGNYFSDGCGNCLLSQEVNCTPFAPCVITGFAHPAGCELHFILMVSPGNRKVCFTSSSRKSF